MGDQGDAIFGHRAHARGVHTDWCLNILPTAVKDRVEALLHLAANVEEIGLNQQIHGFDQILSYGQHGIHNTSSPLSA